MGKIKMAVENDVTFAEGCEEYILDCKARNLRGGTLRHYTDSARQIMKYIGENILIKDIDKDVIDDFIIQLRENPALNDMSLYTYARDFKTLMYFFMRLDKTSNDMIFIERDKGLSREEVEAKLRILLEAVELGGYENVVNAVKKTVPTYCDPNEVNNRAADSEEMSMAFKKTAEAAG